MFEINGCKFIIDNIRADEVFLIDVGSPCDLPIGAVAEDVCNWLYLHYGDRVFIYRDRNGGIDELRHCGGVFSGVGPYAD